MRRPTKWRPRSEGWLFLVAFVNAFVWGGWADSTFHNEWVGLLAFLLGLGVIPVAQRLEDWNRSKS